MLTMTMPDGHDRWKTEPDNDDEEPSPVCQNCNEHMPDGRFCSTDCREDFKAGKEEHDRDFYEEEEDNQ